MCGDSGHETWRMRGTAAALIKVLVQTYEARLVLRRAAQVPIRCDACRPMHTSRERRL